MTRRIPGEPLPADPQDPEAPEADALEQQAETVATDDADGSPYDALPSTPAEVDTGDYAESAFVVPFDDEDDVR
jgi:hypothetical protein